jgi:hypothetical protein
MSNYKTIENDKPLIFSKKINASSRIIPLSKIKNTLGLTKYFPPICQEWSNSVYVYNSVAIKSINIGQKNLTRLIKSYFSIYYSDKFLYSKRILTRFRRLATNKIFVSKAELKHTSTKVIITLYIYNEERRRLIKRLRRMQAILFPLTNKSYILDKEQYNSTFNLGKRLEFLNTNINNNFTLLTLLEEMKICIIKEIKLEKDNLVTINKLGIRKESLLTLKNLEGNLNKVLTLLSFLKNNSPSFKNYENNYKKNFVKIFLEKEIAIIAYNKLLLALNKYKFEDVFLSRLSPLVSKIYNKEVEFNIVNLKAVYLNSDIFTQAIALKLRNRNNKLLKVLRYFLSMVKLPKINFLKERFVHVNIKKLWVNRVKNLTINSLTLNIKKDNLNTLLNNIFNTSNFSKLLPTYIFTTEKDKYNEIFNKHGLLNNVLLLLKHKNMAGVRLEAKGRLTRRFTASRSVFKIKWKGSLKNIDSSYKGLSSVILRGHFKNNVQYSIINSKTRNGTFGLKGWISGK